MSKKISVRRLATVFTCLFLSLLCSSDALAQFRAGIQGVVLDANGATIPAAKVTLTNQETNIERVVTTTADGVFTISSLPPAKYSLTAEKTGFSKKVLSDVLVKAEQTLSLQVTLDVGEISQSITIEAAAAPLINTESATIGGTITSKQVESLPSFSRDPYQLLRLAPGTFGDGAQNSGGSGSQLPGTNKSGPSSTDSIFQVENGPGIIANGTRQNSNNFQIDGLSVNSTAWGGSAVVTPNEESVKEVTVVSNNYSAETGRTGGAQVEVVSKNGTNDLHGSAFFKWHRPGLNAYQRWNGPGTPSPVVRDNARFNQFGGSLGGPILKNKLFAFFSYETLRNNSVDVANGWYETPQFLANAGPSNSIARLLLSQPGTGPRVTQIINQSCADVGLSPTQCHDVQGGLDLGSPLKTALGTNDPTFGKPGTPFGIGGGFDGIPDAMHVLTVSPNTNTSVQYNGRADYNPSSKDAITFSIYWTPVETHSFNGPARAANYWNHISTAKAISGIYTHTFSPTLLNEARFGVSGWNWDEIATNPQAALGLPNATFPAGQGIGTAIGLQNFGAPGPGVFNQKTYNARDTLTKVQGSHYLKFGADVSKALFLDTAPWGGRPNYDFRSLWDFANDAPFDESSNFNPVTGTPTAATKDLRFDILAFFIQDDWKVRPNLTLNLGLRYEYFSPLTEAHGNISNVVVGGGSTTLADLRIRKGGNLFDTSKANWGPQVGFAWTPKSMLGRGFNNKFVLRGGFGIGYNLQQLAITSNGRFNPPFETNLTLLGSNILYAPGSSLHDLNSYPSNPAAKQTFNANGLPTSGAPVSLTGFPAFMHSTATYRYSIEGQYDVGGNWVASLGYQGSQSRHYTIQNMLNYTLYPQSNPLVHSVDWYSNDANASFNALLAGVRHRFSQTFEVDFEYRYAQSSDQGSQDYYQDPYPWDLRYGRGPSDFDVTHNFKAYGIWTPRIFSSNHAWLERLAGGWTISAILNAHTGFPWTPEYCNTNGSVVYPNSNYGCLYPAAYGGGAGTNYGNSTFMSQNGNFQKGSLSYFTVPTWPTFGIPAPPASSIHRNAFRGPGYLGTDLTLAKAFGLGRVRFLGEGAKLTLQASAYNVFNKLNLLVPGANNNTAGNNISNDGVTSNPQFGQSQGAFGGRIIELQARFSF